MTTLCLWLGYRFARERAANELIARHDAVLSVLIKQIATAPSSTFYGNNPGSEDELSRHLSFPGKGFRRTTILKVDHSASTTSQSLVVDVSQLLKNKVVAQQIADDLVNYYASGLPGIGMQRTTSVGASSGYSANGLSNETGKVRGIWSSPKSDLTVVIDATVESINQQGNVSILLLDSQQIRLW